MADAPSHATRSAPSERAAVCEVVAGLREAMSSEYRLHPLRLAIGPAVCERFVRTAGCRRRWE